MCRATSTWPVENTRDFKSVEAMNSAMIDNINACVQQDDELYHLGDWSFAGIENIWNFRKRINCKTIHLILGNHDDHIKKNRLLPNCNQIDYNEFSLIGDIYAQDLFTSVQPMLELTIDKQLVILCHYPIEQWKDADRGSIHLHGHCHNKISGSKLNTEYKRMDVGIDWKEYRPYSWDEIKSIMDKRKVLERYGN